MSNSDDPVPSGSPEVPESDVLRRALDNVALLTDALGAAREEAERANEAKSRFLSRMSHELRTPLNAILGFTQLLRLDELPGEQGDNVDHILQAGRHLLELIDEVLNLDRLESGETQLAVETVVLGPLVADVMELVAPLASARSLRLEYLSGPGRSLQVPADRQRLRQVLFNLLANAVNYNREGGSVVVTAERSGDRVRLAVADTGVGIATADLGRVFEPFERLDAARLGVEGTGLGLTLARELVRLMGGEVSVVSAVGEGSTFTVSLPAAARSPAGVVPPPRNREPSPLQRRLGHIGSRTILVVEDNAANYRMVERLLSRSPELHLIWAVEGRTGVALAVEHRPDLVLLDLHLPDIHGLEVLAELRKDRATAGIPVIVVSADTYDDTVRAVLDGGAEAFISKPFSLEELVDGLERALTRPN